MDGLRILLMILLTVIGSSVRAEVYTWTDENGVRHFSDTPVEGAKRVKLPPPNRYAPPSSSGSPAVAAPLPKVDARPFRYETVRIVLPEDGQTIRENAGRIEVSVEIRPPLREVRGDRLEVVLDGTESRVTEGGGVVFENVPRGEHRVVARILDANGEVLAESAPITFYLHRYSALFDAPSDAEGGDAGPIRRAPMMPRAPMAPRAPRLPARQ